MPLLSEMENVLYEKAFAGVISGYERYEASYHTSERSAPYGSGSGRQKAAQRPAHQPCRHATLAVISAFTHVCWRDYATPARRPRAPAPAASPARRQVVKV